MRNHENICHNFRSYLIQFDQKKNQACYGLNNLN